MNHYPHQHLQKRQHSPDEKTTGMILQDACTSLTQNLQMQSINSYQHISSQYIDQVVEIEMKRLKANCSREEENYVEQMLLENPIIVERRTTPTTLTTSSLTETNNNNEATDYCYSTVQDVNVGKDEEMFGQQQRSESCRRSRINNKIKKAKSKYRHKFMSNKLLQSANVLQCLQKLIEQTENQLINQGFNALQLLELRKVFYNDAE
ncbi:Protein sisterless A [Lucilia cuprina]|uniref:Protein sisterless A n=1 Tax=Lucilia cuprina TaxID=7375 RepID=A0A0L0BRH6_LUCCU|nr:Protein sisterless A [Lucilia cuprina]KNC22593.1 Protein sisterless A [Lucilia cuprina]